MPYRWRWACTDRSPRSARIEDGAARTGTVAAVRSATHCASTDYDPDREHSTIPRTGSYPGLHRSLRGAERVRRRRRLVGSVHLLESDPSVHPGRRLSRPRADPAASIAAHVGIAAHLRVPPWLSITTSSRRPISLADDLSDSPPEETSACR